MEQATGPLADPIDRDLFSDGRHFDELGWRGLWSYVTTAPTGTAIHQALTEGWTLGDKIAAEQLFTERWLLHRYTARNFVGGGELPTPEEIDYPGRGRTAEEAVAISWETATIDELMPPEVRELMKGA